MKKKKHTWDSRRVMSRAPTILPPLRVTVSCGLVAVVAAIGSCSLL
jgi:hypothetical protein